MRTRSRRLRAALLQPRLSAKLLLGLLVAVSLALGVQFFISLRFTQTSLATIEARRVKENLAVAQNLLAERKGELERVTDAAASAEVAHTRVDQRQVARRLIKRTVEGHPDLAMVYDAHGRLLATGGETLSFLTGEPVVRSAERGHALSQYLTWENGLWMLSSCPLRDGATGHRWGIVVTGIKVDERVARQLKQTTNTEISFIVGRDVVATTSAALRAVIARLDPTSFFYERGRVYNTGGYSTAFERLSGPGREAYIAVSVSRQPIDAARESLLWHSLVSIVVALGVAVTVAGVLSVHLTGRIARLIAAAKALAAGDLAQRVTIGGNDEISALGTTFNAMAQQVAEAHATLRNAAVRDSLTGLLNHREFFKRLGNELARAARHGGPVSVLMIDLDHFKEINDRHGHLRGDALLSDVAAAIEANIRGEDVAARYGGDEFAVVLPDADRDYAVGVGERLREAVAALDAGGSPRIGLTLSIGVATQCAGGLDANRLVEAADKALYRAKSGGRDRLEVVAAPVGS